VTHTTAPRAFSTDVVMRNPFSISTRQRSSADLNTDLRSSSLEGSNNNKSHNPKPLDHKVRQKKQLNLFRHMKFSAMIVMLLGSRAAAFTARSTMVPRRVLTRSMAATVDGEGTATEQTIAEIPTKIPDMEEIVSLCKRRGIIFPSSEIYNGYAGFYDYGPLGVELKKNIKDAWWKHFVTQREDVVGLDSSIIHNPTTWKSSGASSEFLGFHILKRFSNFLTLS
jgi:hypothetical protein